MCLGASGDSLSHLAPTGPVTRDSNQQSRNSCLILTPHHVPSFVCRALQRFLTEPGEARPTVLQIIAVPATVRGTPAMCRSPCQLPYARGVPELGAGKRSLLQVHTLGPRLASPVRMGVVRVAVLSGGSCPESGAGRVPRPDQLHLRLSFTGSRSHAPSLSPV